VHAVRFGQGKGGALGPWAARAAQPTSSAAIAKQHQADQSISDLARNFGDSRASVMGIVKHSANAAAA